MMTRTAVSTALCGVVLVAAAAAAAASPAGTLCFTNVGDWGRDFDTEAKVGAGMAKRAAAVDCDFTISNGDNFYSAGVSSTSDPLWQTAFEKVYTEPALQNDWWITVGNHDYGHGFPGIQAQIDYTGLSKRWQFPSNFYAQTFAVDTGVTAQFVFLDTVNLTSAQQTWAQAQLKASTADYLWVVGHYPIYSGGSHGNVMESSPLHSWLQAANVTAYLCGHDHDLQHLQSNGIDFFVNGGGSTERDDGGDIPQTVFHSGASGTGMAEMTKESVTWTYNDESGSVLYTTTIAPRPMSEGAVRAREAAFASSPPPSARDQIIISDEDIPALRDAVMAHVNPAGPQPIVIEVPAERPHHL